MKSTSVTAAVALLCATAGLASHAASATTFNVDCGAAGPATPLQDQINAIGSTPDQTIVVRGTCVGDVDTSFAKRFTIFGLTLQGTLSMTAATGLRFSGLTLTGTLLLTNTHLTRFDNMVAQAEIDVNHGSQATFNTLSLSPSTGPSGPSDPIVNCIGQSECTLRNATIAGSGTSDTSVGVLAGSASRLNFSSGSIGGFGIGVQVWNNATAFLTSSCDPIKISSNRVTGVYVTDSGTVKVEGAEGCPASVAVDVSSNGQYGVLADGGGNAYLFLTNISGHQLDGVRVQHGSTVRIRSSKIDAAFVSGRSARVKGQSHLFFDEQAAGPAAGSTLVGPVCVTGNSTTDTENSSTTLTVVPTCPGP